MISLTAATANFAGAANSTGAQPVVGATTHPIQYWIGCAPSMVTTTNLNYFKQQGFTAVCVVVPDSQTYQTQLTTIKSLNMLPIIDIEMPIWDGGQLQSTPISNFASYFQSLKTAGWQYVASEGGRTGDLTYLKQYFKGYVNFNCDQCGLWEGGNPVYTNPFTVANSWESYYTSEWSYIQTGAKQAAALGIQNGILAGTWANSGGDNQIYANSVSGSGTSYLSMLNWSYANGIGFTSFHVWCGDNPNGLSQYKSLGFDKIVAAMQVYYPATKSASLGTGKQGTQLTLTASNTTPAVNQSVTFKATLTLGGTPFSEPVTIYHYLNGVRYNDTTAYTTLTFATKWASAGTRTYYASFAGDSSYQASTSSAVTINVKAPLDSKPTKLSLTASNTTPAVNQSVTFKATLTTGGTPISEPISVWHYIGTSGTKYTDASGYSTLTFATKWASAGTRTYYASFAGDSSYLASTSSAVTVKVTNVKTSASSAVTVNVTNATNLKTALTITAPASALMKQNFTINGTLSASALGIGNGTITLQRSTDNATWTNVTTNVTNTTGGYQFSNNESAAKSYYYRTACDGNATYLNATSNTVNVNVTKMPTALTLIASNTTPAVNQKVTFNATLSSRTMLLSGENVTIYHYLNGVRYNDATNITNANGQISVTASFGSLGQRTYYATFAGDSSYLASTSSAVTVTAQ